MGFVALIMEGRVPDGPGGIAWFVRLVGDWVVWGAAVLLALVAAIGMWPRSREPGKDLYFRRGDPSPLAFPILRTGMGFHELELDPQGGEGFEVGFEWRPKSGPFDHIMAAPPEGSGVGMCAAYHVRPRCLSAFRSSLDAAFAGYDRESGPKEGEAVWPDVHGYRLALLDGWYSVNPVDPDDLAVSRLFKGLKRGSIMALAVLCLAVVLLRWRRRFRPT